MESDLRIVNFGVLYALRNHTSTEKTSAGGVLRSAEIRIVGPGSCQVEV
jgi:hypothetical protein